MGRKKETPKTLHEKFWESIEESLSIFLDCVPFVAYILTAYGTQKLSEFLHLEGVEKHGMEAFQVVLVLKALASPAAWVMKKVKNLF